MVAMVQPRAWTIAARLATRLVILTGLSPDPAPQAEARQHPAMIETGRNPVHNPERCRETNRDHSRRHVLPALQAAVVPAVAAQPRRTVAAGGPSNRPQGAG